jgi:signal transduction histidine kinase
MVTFFIVYLVYTNLVLHELRVNSFSAGRSYKSICIVQNHFVASMQSSLNPNLELGHEVAAYRRRAIAAVQLAFVVGGLAVLTFESGAWPVKAGILTGICFSAISLVLALKQHLGPATFILSVELLVLPTYLALRAMGTYDAAVLLYPAGMMSMAVVTPPRQTAVFALMTMLCVGAVALATNQHWIGNQSLSAITTANPTDVYAVLVIVAFAAFVAVYVSVILTGVLRKLSEHQAALEHNIAVRTQELAASNEDLRLAVRHLDGARTELVRGEKLAGLGSLVAGVAHELNTPIGNSAVTASTLLHDVGEVRNRIESGTLRKSDLNAFIARCDEGAQLLVNSTHRASELVRSFKQVAVDQTSDRRREFDLGQTVQELLRSMRPSFKIHAGLVIECHIAQGIQCNGYPGPLGQVITNLVQNAIFHGLADRAQGRVQLDAKMLDAYTVQLTIEDDGRGIEAGVLGKIYDPFFTTRLGQGGSGLGLTIVHNLVTAVLGGRIDVSSTVGQGSRFTLTLPVTAPEQRETRHPIGV